MFSCATELQRTMKVIWNHDRPLQTFTHIELQEGMVSLEDLMGHLEPSDEDLKALQSAADQQLTEETNKIGVISLSAKPEVHTSFTLLRVADISGLP